MIMPPPLKNFKMPKTNTPKLIDEFSKNNLEVIRVQITNFNGQPLLDVRVWILKGEDYIPTKKGISLRLEQVGALRDGIAKAAAEVDKLLSSKKCNRMQ